MTQLDALITFASWEDRFYLGLEKTFRIYATGNIVMYYYEEYADRTKENRAKISQLCAKKRITLKSTKIAAKSPADSWRIYGNEFLATQWTSKNVLVDISTMPRDSIWSLFFFLKKAGANISYIYYRPATYGDWLSRDPEKPRLLFKHSGVARLGYPTGLVIVTGFDPDRTLQLINFFEPKLALVGIQTGSQFESNKKNVNAHRLALRGHHNIHIFKLDAYTVDHGQAIIEQEVSKYMADYNIIMSSLGPKPSAVALYKVCRKYPDVALAYAPSREFNLDYSHGIGRKIGGKLE